MKIAKNKTEDVMMMRRSRPNRGKDNAGYTESVSQLGRQQKQQQQSKTNSIYQNQEQDKQASKWLIYQASLGKRKENLICNVMRLSLANYILNNLDKEMSKG